MLFLALPLFNTEWSHYSHQSTPDSTKVLQKSTDLLKKTNLSQQIP